MLHVVEPIALHRRWLYDIGKLALLALVVVPVGDCYEQEADRVAQQVVQQLDTAAQPPASQAVQR
jgi:hypothetical protein